MPTISILYVEDNLLRSLVNSAVIREGGFDVVEVYCAAEAVAVIERHAPLGALVTDINLGSGADGFEVSRCARAAYPAIPVIYVSAAAAARIPLEGVEGAQFIAKPFHPWQIVEALDRLVHLEAILASDHASRAPRGAARPMPSARVALEPLAAGAPS